MAKTKQYGLGYENDPMRGLAESFNRVTRRILSENQLNIFTEGATVYNDDSAASTLKDFFIKESYDPASMNARETENFIKDRSLLFENTIEAMQEAAITGGINGFNPVVGMTLPMFKDIMMNMVWDKGGIPSQTTDGPKITRTHEKRILVTPKGEEFDFFLEQNMLTKAMRSVNPVVKVVLNAGETGTTEIVHAKLNGDELNDHLDVSTYVSAIKIKGVFYAKGDIKPGTDGFVHEEGVNGSAAVVTENGEEHDTFINVDYRFNPGYGECKRIIMQPVKIRVKKGNVGDGTNKMEIVEDTLIVNQIGDRFQVVSATGNFTAIELSCRLDASARSVDTATVKWTQTQDFREIPTDEGISAQITPEELKDVMSLFNVDQLTKLMSMMKTVMANRRDDEIKEYIDLDYTRMDQRSKFHKQFDFAPREGYMGDHLRWRHDTFFDFFDTYATEMLRVLNDPNMSFSFFGEPDIVRKIVPPEYNYAYTSPDSIGPVELDFEKTVVTSNKRVYNFIGSDKLRNNYEGIITLNPRNTLRITYMLYNYQFYISNEIRKKSNAALPQVTMFDRYLMDSYQPVQGRLQILNPSGMRPSQSNTTSWGTTAELPVL